MANKKLSPINSEQSVEADKPLGMVFSTDTPCDTEKKNRKHDGNVHVFGDTRNGCVNDVDVINLDDCTPCDAVLTGVSVVEDLYDNITFNY